MLQDVFQTFLQQEEWAVQLRMIGKELGIVVDSSTEKVD